MKKSFLTTKEISEIGVFAALSFAFDAVQGGLWRGLFPNGGSIGIAMLPILIISYRRGFKCGLFSALILSFVQMLSGIYTLPNNIWLVFLQILLDYVLAYPLVAFAGIFRKKSINNGGIKIPFLVIGCVVGGFLKYMCHVGSGCLFWSSNAPDGFPGGFIIYSLFYNGLYMIPNIILNSLLMLLIGKQYSRLLLIDDVNKPFVVNNDNARFTANLISSIIFFGLFTIFIILSIYGISTSLIITDYGNGSFNFEVNEDYIALLFSSLILLGCSLYFLKSFITKKHFKKVNVFKGVCFFSIFGTLYCFGKMIKKVIAQTSFDTYQHYLYFALIFAIILIGSIILMVKTKRK